MHFYTAPGLPQGFLFSEALPPYSSVAAVSSSSSSNYNAAAAAAVSSSSKNYYNAAAAAAAAAVAVSSGSSNNKQHVPGGGDSPVRSPNATAGHDGRPVFTLGAVHGLQRRQQQVSNVRHVMIQCLYV
jgi:hypothetical protein